MRRRFGRGSCKAGASHPATGRTRVAPRLRPFAHGKAGKDAQTMQFQRFRGETRGKGRLRPAESAGSPGKNGRRAG